MYNPFANVWNLGAPLVWVDFGIGVLVMAAFCYIYTRLFDRKTAYIVSISAAAVLLVSWFFELKMLFTISTIVVSALVVGILVLRQNELAELLKVSLTKKRRSGAERVYDRHAICQQIAVAVENLSRTKTGALITFEKEDMLDDVIKTGTLINAPVIPELLTTIFYPGTRLHDGAVVIRRDKIHAASVYYTPTTKPLTGKFGSRHRAAIGISELTDSVTVVVSEETGRISIAYRGELNPVQQDNFLRTLEEYIFAEDKEEGENK